MRLDVRVDRAAATRMAAVAAVLCLLLVAYRFGVFSSLREPRKLAATLVAMGGWGYVAFIGAYTLLQPFGVPGTVFIVAAPLLWPWRTAFALSMIGTMCASVVGFSFARHVARDWIARRIPARFRKYDDAIEANALRTVIVLRLLFWMPPLLHAFFGVSRVRFWTHFWGSLVGYVPPLLVVSYLGAELFDGSGHLQTKSWPAFAGLLALSLVVAAIAKRMSSPSKPAAEPAPSEKLATGMNEGRARPSVDR